MELLEKMVEQAVVKELKENVYLRSDAICDLFENFDPSEEELEKIFDIINASKKINSFNNEDGYTYYFGTSKNQVREFVKEDLNERADDWNKYIYCDGKSYPLNWFVED